MDGGGGGEGDRDLACHGYTGLSKPINDNSDGYSEGRPQRHLPTRGHGGPQTAHDPQLLADADVGEAHDAERQDEHDPQHVDLVQLRVHRVLPVLHAPVGKATMADLLVNLKGRQIKQSSSSVNVVSLFFMSVIMSLLFCIGLYAP